MKNSVNNQTEHRRINAFILKSWFYLYAVLLSSFVSFSASGNGNTPHKSSFGLFIRKIKLLRRIKKAKRRRIRKEKRAKKRFQRRRRWRIFRFLIRKTFEKYFQPDKSEMERRRAWKEEKRWIRAEYRWKRRKRWRMLKFIVRRSIQKCFEKKTEDEIRKQALNKLSRKERRKRLIRLSKFVLRKRVQRTIIYLKNFPNQPIRPAYNLFASSKISKDQFLVIVLNSTAYYILAYLLLYMLMQFITALVALHFDYQTIVYYYDLYYNIVTTAWTFDSVKILYSMPSLVSIFLGVVLFIFYRWVENENGSLKMLILWMVFLGSAHFFGSLLIGAVLDKGFGYVIMYLYYLDTERMTMVFISLFGLLVSGTILTRPFMVSGNTYFNELNEHNRPAFMYGQVLLPFLLGTGIILLAKLPEIKAYEALILVSGILPVMPIMATYKSYNEMYFDLEPRKISLTKIAIILAILLFAAFRIVLSYDIVRIGSV